MKRRILVLGAAAAAMLTASAIPVFAEDSNTASESSAGLVDKTLQGVESIVNPIAEGIPTPPGWNNRHICAWSDQADRTFCLFFPWPI